MNRIPKNGLILFCLFAAHNALADGSLNAMEDFVYMAIGVTVAVLLSLAALTSLLLNYLIFKRIRNVGGAFVGALAISIIPTIMHGLGDYTAFLFAQVALWSLGGGLLGYYLGLRKLKSK